MYNLLLTNNKGLNLYEKNILTLELEHHCDCVLGVRVK